MLLKIINMAIPVDKIREVIGSGGKVIQGYCCRYRSKIDIEEDGRIYIAAVDTKAGELAKR